MASIALDDGLEVVMQLSEEQQTMLLEIIQQRQIEEWRSQAAKQARASIKAFHEGKLQPQSFEQILDVLNN